MADQPPTFLTQIAPFVSPVISVGLSAFVAWVTARRVTAKANTRLAFSEVLEALDSVHSATNSLLLTAGVAPEAHRDLRAIQHADYLMGRRLAELFRSRKLRLGATASQPVPNSINAARIELRKLVTDTSLIAAQRAPYPATDGIFVELEQRCLNLRTAIREAAEDLKVGDLQ